MANFYGSYIGYGASADAGGGAWIYPGSLYGYILGGNVNPATSTVNHIQRYIFATDSDAADINNLTLARSYSCSSLTSASYGYCAGGSDPSMPGYDRIERWTFAPESDSTDTGNLTVGRGGCTGASSSTHGYVQRGHSGVCQNIIDKFSVADGTQNATDEGDLAFYGTQGYGHSSVTHGYHAGGYNCSPSPAGYQSNIEKVTFADDTLSGDIGDIMVARAGRGGASSPTHAYCGPGEGDTTRIDNYAFADESVTTDVGNIGSSDGYGTGGASNSVTAVYFATGHVINAIDKLVFATGGNAVDTANVAVPINEGGGTHV